MEKTVTINGKAWTKEKVKELIKSNDEAARRALIKIYECQTADEQNSENTKYYNGVGFNGLDAGILSSMAKWYLEKKFLTKGQLDVVKRKLTKYAGQILNMMEQDQRSLKPE